LIAGDFYERSGEYTDFIETLRDPRKFRRHKHFVLDRPSLNSPTCETPHEVAYHPGLAKHEPRRDRDRI
jgi:hypothetical protein